MTAWKAFALVSLAGLLLVGCGPAESPEETAESLPLNGYRPGRGVFVCAETRENLKLQLQDVTDVQGTEGEVLVPESAVLDAPEGLLVYTVNDDHFLKTPVKRSGRVGRQIRISDGLTSGDVVVANPMGIRLIELNVTRAGAACCEVPEEPRRK